MRILVYHKTEQPLVLPLSYHQKLQGIIYHNIVNSHGYSGFLHDDGYRQGDRSFRMFTFSLIRGKYEILKTTKQIRFYEDAAFEVSSPDVYMLRILAESLTENGITYGDQHYDQVQVFVSDATVESEDMVIGMLSPVCVYETDPCTKKTYFYSPEEEGFSHGINQNFRRKYFAYYGVEPQEDIFIQPLKVSQRDKYVTVYKNFRITGWKGIYRLQGSRKYLDFLLQAGLGGKNSQGFGMFEEILDVDD